MTCPPSPASSATTGLGAAREGGDLDAYLAALERMVVEGGNTLVVGTLEGRIIATFQITFILGLPRRANRRAQIESVGVAPDLRSRGIGAALMSEAERRAVAACGGMIQLTTHANRDRARAIYDRAGYAPTHIGYKKMLGGR